MTDMKMKSVFIVFLSALILMSCGSVKEPPVFRSVKNVQIGELTGETVDVSADVVLYNPNTIGYKIQNIVVDVMQGENLLVKIDQEVNKKMIPEGETLIPMSAKVRLEDVLKGDGLESLIGSFLSQEVDIGFVGYVTVKAVGIPIKVPIDEKKSVKL